VRLYRAVSEAELQDIRSFGGFRPNPDIGYAKGFETGKWFAESEEGAIKWGKQFMVWDKSVYYVVYFDIPTASVAKLYQKSNLDGYGPARLASVGVELDRLNQDNSGIIISKKLSQSS